MKKLLLPALFLMVVLAACGTGEDKGKGESNAEEPKTTATESSGEDVLVDERLQEPAEDTLCAMCNMEVYMKDHEMGVFSAQAIKEDGSNAFYDDIGCLLNAEVANEETNEKFVRDYSTKEWAKVEDVTILKTELKSPMNWGYIHFVDKADADKYVEENPTAYVEELQKVKDEALERRNKKMKEQAEKEAHGESQPASAEMQDGEHGEGH
ncbi:MAG: nitrous oxide reductase accessory protein NosL [Lysinibacillus sp.]